METPVPSAGRDAPPRLVRWLFALCFAAAGLWIEAAALGFAPLSGNGFGASRWPLAIAGMMFFGLALRAIADRSDAGAPAVRLPFLMIVVAVAVLVHWVAFGPGPRHFGHLSRNGGLELGAPGSPQEVMFGRACFGLIALFVDVLIVRACLRRWRSNRRAPAG